MILFVLVLNAFYRLLNTHTHTKHKQTVKHTQTFSQTSMLAHNDMGIAIILGNMVNGMSIILVAIKSLFSLCVCMFV